MINNLPSEIVGNVSDVTYPLDACLILKNCLLSTKLKVRQTDPLVVPVFVFSICISNTILLRPKWRCTSGSKTFNRVLWSKSVLLFLYNFLHKRGIILFMFRIFCYFIVFFFANVLKFVILLAILFYMMIQTLKS